MSFLSDTQESPALIFPELDVEMLALNLQFSRLDDVVHFASEVAEFRESSSGMEEKFAVLNKFLIRQRPAVSASKTSVSYGNVPWMKLPNAESAVVELEKVADYLLNAAHPDNGGKAAFFEALGFHRTEPETLAKALHDLAREAEVTQAATSPHGRKLVIVGEIKSPVGATAIEQTIWIIDKGRDIARLVTAYPHRAWRPK